MKKSFEFSEKVLGFMVKEEMDQSKMEEVLLEIKERLKVVKPICVYLEDELDEGMSIGGFLKAIQFHFSHGEDIDKIAIVSDDKFFHGSMDMKGILVPAKIKSFHKSARVEAMNWVME